eukprot:5320691-Amphidinium_carterae.1
MPPSALVLSLDSWVRAWLSHAVRGELAKFCCGRKSSMRTLQGGQRPPSWPLLVEVSHCMVVYGTCLSALAHLHVAMVKA